MASAVDERYRDLCGTHRRVRHVELVPPVSLMADVMRWREMLLRHRKGDFRNTEAEWRSVKTVAAWTLAENCRLRGQPAIRLECLET